MLLKVIRYYLKCKESIWMEIYHQGREISHDSDMRGVTRKYVRKYQDMD